LRKENDMLAIRIVMVITVLGGLLTPGTSATLIDFETIESWTLVRDQFQSIGVRVTGAGSWSGLVYSEGDLGVYNFGNSPTQIVDIGDRGEPMTIRFVDPANPELVIGACYVSFLMGDGNPDLETFEVTYFDTSGAVLEGPTQYTNTGVDGLPFVATISSLGGLIGFIELVVIPGSQSGIAFDDLTFELGPAAAIAEPRPENAVRVGAHPNPCNPRTTVTYSIPRSGFVEIHVHDTRGRTVHTLVSESKMQGEHRVTWTGRDTNGKVAAPGIYFLRLKFGEQILTGKLVLLK
jgi:hypothetical protein